MDGLSFNLLDRDEDLVDERLLSLFVSVALPGLLTAVGIVAAMRVMLQGIEKRLDKLDAQMTRFESRQQSDYLEHERRLAKLEAQSVVR
jgi:hypothetical protein